MDDESEPSFYVREKGETFESYLQKYKINEMMNIIRHPKTRDRFCRMLYTLWEIEEDVPVDSKYFKNVRSAYNYRVFEYHVRSWAARRKELLDKLSQCCKDLNKFSKCSIFSRIILCLVESSSTIYGLYKTDNMYLEAASVFGAAALFCAVAETLITKQRLLYLNEFVKAEEDLLFEIREWLDQHEEIKKQVMNAFEPKFCRCLKDNIAEIIRGKSLKTYYAEGISILETNRHICDLLKLFMQYLHGDKRYYIYQRITALDKKDWDLLSFHVLGRLFLNALSIVLDSYIWWRNDIPYVHYLSNLQEELKDELDFMNIIISDDVH